MSMYGKRKGISPQFISDQENYSDQEIPNFLKKCFSEPQISILSWKEKNYYMPKKEAALHFILPPFPNLDVTKLVIMRTAANLLILRGQFCSNWCISFPCYIPVLAERQIKEPEADELPLNSHYLVLTGGYKQAGNVRILLPYDNFTSEALSGIVFYLKDFHSSSFFPPDITVCTNAEWKHSAPAHLAGITFLTPHHPPDSIPLRPTAPLERAGDCLPNLPYYRSIAQHTQKPACSFYSP